MAQYLSDIEPHPEIDNFRLVFPTTRSDVIEQFRAHLRALPRKPGGKLVAIIDGIISAPGVLLPWQELVKICKSENVISIVDAAHNIGQELNIKLGEADPDFWVSVSDQHRPIIVMLLNTPELPQMALRKAGMCCIICTKKVFSV